MILKRKIFLILISIFFLFSKAYSLTPVESAMRIGIITDTNSFVLSSKDPFTITDAQNKNLKFQKNASIKLSFSKDKAIGGNDSMILPIKIESKGDIYINNKPYHGSIIVSRTNKGVNIINVLDIEDYIKGVVPKEAIVDWDIEALKTQAVISRSYAIMNLGRHSAQGFDLCDETHCQVYGGAVSETKNTNAAVEKTEGEVLTYNGNVAAAYFFSNSGGYTENPKHVWGLENVPQYLQGIKDPYSKSEPNYNWETVISETFIRNKMRIGKISSIKVSGKTPSGSAKDLVIRYSKGTKTISAANFRTAVDPNKIKSTLITSIVKKGDNFVFKGNGWGHRVGLSQWGAKAMAEKGKTYKSILRFYYPGTKIEKVKYK